MAYPMTFGALLNSSYYLVLTTHTARSPVSPLYLMNDSEDEDDISEVESLERGGLYDRASLSSVAAACLVPNHAELVSGFLLMYNDYS